MDDPPSRVKPLPLTLLTTVVALATQEDTPSSLAASDCLILGFYFLLCSGEYLGHPNDVIDTLFRLRDVSLWIGARSLDLETCTDADLLAATFATLTFTRQTNGVRNKTIEHGRTGHPTLCPVLALASRVRALRHLHASPSAPINAFDTTPGSLPLQHVQSADITAVYESLWPFTPTLPFRPPRFLRVRLAPAAPWPFFAPGSIRTAFGSSTGGDWMNSSDVSTYRLSLS